MKHKKTKRVLQINKMSKTLTPKGEDKWLDLVSAIDAFFSSWGLSWEGEAGGICCSCKGIS